MHNLDYKNENVVFIRKICHPSIGDALIVRTSTFKIELLLPKDE